MEPSEHRKSEHPSTGTAAGGCGRNRNALRDALMGPARVEERDILEEDGAQVLLTPDDDVVEALAAHAAEEVLVQFRRWLASTTSRARSPVRKTGRFTLRAATMSCSRSAVFSATS